MVVKKVQCELIESVFSSNYTVLTFYDVCGMILVAGFVPIDKIGLIPYIIICLAMLGYTYIQSRTYTYSILVAIDKKFTRKRNFILILALATGVGLNLTRDTGFDFPFIILAVVGGFVELIYSFDYYKKYSKLIEFADDSWP